jgi:hypothetical protein
MAANPEVLAYVIDAAKRRGINPDVAVKAFNHEGLSVFNPNAPDRGGDEGSSFGPFQLHYGGMSKSMPHAGMGDDFTKATGLDARDSSTWKQQTDFVMDHLAKGGSWSPWMGAAAEGITGRMGLPGGSDYTAPAGRDPTGVAKAGPPAPGGEGTGTMTAGGPSLMPPMAAGAGQSNLSAGRDALATSAANVIGGDPFKTKASAPIDQPMQIAQVQPSGNAAVADRQRQQMAMSLAKLNQGRLWG